jgi:imidazolonepropionase-like amidohydrolase
VLDIRSRNIIDGTGRPGFAGSIQLLRGRIAAVAAEADAGTAGPEVPAVNLDGYTVMPGLIDAHSHLASVIKPPGSPPQALAVLAAEIFRNLGTALDEGFTTVRELSGLDGGAVQAAAKGLIRAPRILPSGPMISQSCGHGDWRPAFGHEPWQEQWPGLMQGSVLVDGADEARRAARMALRDGATQVKVAISGGFSSDCDELDDVQFSIDELRAIVAAAHGQHKYVTAHAHHSEAVQLGINAGVECFEHATFADSKTLKLVHERGASIVATLWVVNRFQEPAVLATVRPSLRDAAQRALPAMAGMVQEAIGLGITVGCGSDMTGPGQRGRGQELVVRSSITSPLEAISAATAGNAKILRIADETGTLAKGLAADFIVLDGDPVQTPEILGDADRVRLVVQAGEVSKNTLPEPVSHEVSRRLAEDLRAAPSRGV